ncbi:MAG: DUF1877 family protein [bacterium]|nr:DUF1877 family protein [bacterium]
MGMVGGLTQLTPEELERIRRDPKLLLDVERKISETDESRTCDLDKAWHGVHFLLVGDAGPKENRWTLLLYLAVSASIFIASALIARLLVISGGSGVALKFLHRILSAVGPLSGVVFLVSGAIWLKVSGVRSLRMALSRKRMGEPAFVPPEAVRKVMLGGSHITDSEDLSAYYATPEEVRALAPMLKALSDNEVRRRFDGVRMRMLGIYLFSNGGHADESWFGYALDNLHRAVAFYQDAARRGNAVVFSFC